MATLVFTAVGQALGGPLGAALGSIVGRSIDESLFGPGPRKGPRLGDLSVQTSSYGSMVPRIYGTMRVAGTVIWSTDLIEEETVEGGGKGTPATQGYKYSVSLAVALSSRPVREVRRIWADGKLIRGAAGDLKVKTKFRLATGDGDQPVDPMIAAIEMIDTTPAYRGTALAIFEGLELAEFGNRIPQLTFEIIADGEPVGLGKIAADIACEPALQASATEVRGYAAHGMTKREAIEALVEVGGLDLLDDGTRLRTVEMGPSTDISAVELGCSVDAEGVRPERQRHPADGTASLALTFYDPERDYQTGQVRVASGSGGQQDRRFEFPAVVDAGGAKAIAERLMAKWLMQADGLRLRLPPSYLWLKPGALVDVEDLGQWQVQSMMLEDMAVVTDLRRPPRSVAPMVSDGGRATTQPDTLIGRTSLALIELPPIAGVGGMYVAGSNEGKWKPVPVELSFNNALAGAVSLPRKARLGRTVAALADGVDQVFDRRTNLEIELVDPAQQLFNADADALDRGANLAAVGRELIQYRRAQDLGSGRWLLSNLLRGCRGTEWAMRDHQVGEHFCLLDYGVVSLDNGAWLAGGAVGAVANGISDVTPLPVANTIFGDEANRPPSPCKLTLAVENSALFVRWTGRSWAGFGWAEDGLNQTGDYQLVLSCAGLSNVTTTSATSASVPLNQIPGTGNRRVDVSVSTVRNGKSSHPAIASIEI